MKKFMMMSVSLSIIAISGMAQAADFKTLTTTTPMAQPQNLQAAPLQPVASAPQAAKAQKKSSLTSARIVPDTTPAPVPAAGAPKKSDQGYSDISTYNVVNDQNKPITNDWSRPKSWRIGYKNKNRTPINE